jgi:prophage regulatory protein
MNYKQLKDTGINFSREHLWRLERANKFPRRIYLSPQKVAWFEDEIFGWLEQRAAERATRVYRVHD